MAKKAKWLEEGTQESLLMVIKDTLSQDEIDPKAQKKALNATTELIERLPQDEVTIIDNLENLVSLAGVIKEQYNTESEMVSEDVEDGEDTDEPEIEDEKDLEDYTKKELKAMAKELEIKVGKKDSADDIIAKIREAQGEEADEDEEDDSEEGAEVEDILAELDLKDLKKLAKGLDIGVKGKKQEALIDELAAHDDIEEALIEAGYVDIDEEDSEDEEDEVDYESLSKKELKALLKERGFKVDKKASKEDMIETLENN